MALAPLVSDLSIRNVRSLSIGKIDHISLRVRHPANTARFYASLFGAEVKRSTHPIVSYPGSEPVDHYWVKAGSSYLAIVPQCAGGQIGLDHFCLNLPQASPDRVMGILQEFRKVSGNFSSSWAENLFARDLAGNIFHVIANAMGYWEILESAVKAVIDEKLSKTDGDGVLVPANISCITIPATRTASVDVYGKLFERYNVKKIDDMYDFGEGRIRLRSHLNQALFQVRNRGPSTPDIIPVALDLGALSATQINQIAYQIVDPDGILFELLVPDKI